MRRVLFKNDAAIYDYLDAGVVQEMVQTHLSGKENRRLLIWSLLNVEQWCQEFL